MVFGESASLPGWPPHLAPGFLESPVQILQLVLVLNSDGGSRLGTHWGANLLFSSILPGTYPHRATRPAGRTREFPRVQLRLNVAASPRAGETDRPSRSRARVGSPRWPPQSSWRCLGAGG